MARRVHVPILLIGRMALPDDEAHHIRDVLRMGVGDELELFDDDGNTAAGRIAIVTSIGIAVDVSAIGVADQVAVALTVAAAVPKGDRADWMIEKLSELGVTRFVPVVAARSVTVPGGKNKVERWERIAVEAAKQSRRAGVMTVDTVKPFAEVLGGLTGWMLSTGTDVVPASRLVTAVGSALTVLVGPEGGWTVEELAAARTAGWRAVGLGRTVLRVETAAVAVAAIVACGV